MAGNMNRLASEQVVVQAPMSFTGSARRLWRMTRSAPTWLNWALLYWLALFLILGAWMAIAVWYATFNVLLVPYRLLRRGSRKRKRDELRHREILNATAVR